MYVRACVCARATPSSMVIQCHVERSGQMITEQRRRQRSGTALWMSRLLRSRTFDNLCCYTQCRRAHAFYPACRFFSEFGTAFSFLFSASPRSKVSSDRVVFASPLPYYLSNYRSSVARGVHNDCSTFGVHRI